MRDVAWIMDSMERQFRQNDFTAVSYDAPRFDNRLGPDGLHRVYPTVAPRARATILPPELFERYSKLAFWRDLPKSKAFRIVVQQDIEPQQATMPEQVHKLEADAGA